MGAAPLWMELGMIGDATASSGSNERPRMLPFMVATTVERTEQKKNEGEKHDRDRGRVWERWKVDGGKRGCDERRESERSGGEQLK